MNSKVHRVSFTSSNSYNTLNSLTNSTKNIWLVFHGMGYLSRYFLKYFKTLDPAQNYIIAPQAPSKYYQGPNFKHVGASWLTREDTQQETINVLDYVNAVVKQQQIKNDPRLIIMGYSQGVSIAMRYMAKYHIQVKELILHSGGIPVELSQADLAYLNPKTPVTYIYGSKDQYINEARKTEQQLLGENLFGDRLTIKKFDGIHEVYLPFLEQVANKNKEE